MFLCASGSYFRVWSSYKNLKKIKKCKTKNLFFTKPKFYAALLRPPTYGLQLLIGLRPTMRMRFIIENRFCSAKQNSRVTLVGCSSSACEWCDVSRGCGWKYDDATIEPSRWCMCFHVPRQVTAPAPRKWRQTAAMTSWCSLTSWWRIADATRCLSDFASCCRINTFKKKSPPPFLLSSLL